MSWHFLQDQAAASWEASSLDGAPSALLKLMPTADLSCSRDNATAFSNHSRFGMTLQRSTGTRGAAGLMWYQGDSRVRTYLPLEKVQVSEASDQDCGPNSHESLAKYNQDSYSWKTAQCSLLGGLIAYSETFPAWGTMRDGELFQQPTLVRPILDGESGYWPTPDCRGFVNEGALVALAKKTDNAQEFYAMAYRAAMKKKQRIYPAPTAHMAKETNAPSEAKRNEPSLAVLAGGRLNPTWVEWLMGWPLGWTDLKPLVMDKFQQWRDSHGGS